MFEGHLLNPVHYTDHIYVYWCEGVEGLDGEQVEWVCVKGFVPCSCPFRAFSRDFYSISIMELGMGDALMGWVDGWWDEFRHAT